MFDPFLSPFLLVVGRVMAALSAFDAAYKGSSRRQAGCRCRYRMPRFGYRVLCDSCSPWMEAFNPQGRQMGDRPHDHQKLTWQGSTSHVVVLNASYSLSPTPILGFYLWAKCPHNYLQQAAEGSCYNDAEQLWVIREAGKQATVAAPWVLLWHGHWQPLGATLGSRLLRDSA